MATAALVLFLLVPAVIVVLTALFSTVVPRRRAGAAERFAEAAGVRLTPELAVDVIRRLRRRDVLDFAARLVAVAMLLLPPAWGVGGGVAVLAMLAALGGGRTLAHLTEARRAGAGQARVTHLLRPRLTGYLRPTAVWCVRAVGLLPAGLAVVWFAGSARRPLAADSNEHLALAGDDRATLVLAGLALASLLLAETTAQLVLRQRRVAGSPAALALDDAFRVSALRDLSVLPIVFGVAGGFMIGSLLTPDRPPWLGLAAVALAAVAVCTEAAHRRAWLGRLHPEAVRR